MLSTVEHGDTPSRDPQVRRYELPPGRLIEYAADRATRRLGAIEAARGVPLERIDLDASPLELEERFGDEDQAAMASPTP